ncbi:protein maintenance of PSII under high light 1 [Tanacetum coccineum]
MGSTATALSANSCMRLQFFNNNGCFKNQYKKQNLGFFKIRASADGQQEDDCNVEECAPDKEVGLKNYLVREFLVDFHSYDAALATYTIFLFYCAVVGKVSMEWLAGEKTKVAGTFPPRRRDWSGYVEKDTAGQTNIYSVEPAVYVAESALSSGTSGTSADGSENTAALFAFGALIAVASASTILLQVGKNSPQIQTLDYSGPSLSYYITKFKPSEIVQISVPTETAPSVQTESSTPQVDSAAPETETSAQLESSTPQIDLEASETKTSAQPESSTPQVDSEAQETTTSVSAEQPESATPQVIEVQVESG